MNDDIEISIKVNREILLSEQSSFGMFSSSIKSMVQDQIAEQVAQKVMKQLKIPKDLITKEGLKKAVIDKFAEKIIENYFEKEGREL